MSFDEPFHVERSAGYLPWSISQNYQGSLASEMSTTRSGVSECALPAQVRTSIRTDSAAGPSASMLQGIPGQKSAGPASSGPCASGASCIASCRLCILHASLCSKPLEFFRVSHGLGRSKTVEEYARLKETVGENAANSSSTNSIERGHVAGVGSLVLASASC